MDWDPGSWGIPSWQMADVLPGSAGAVNHSSAPGRSNEGPKRPTRRQWQPLLDTNSTRSLYYRGFRVRSRPASLLWALKEREQNSVFGPWVPDCTDFGASE